MASLGAKVLQTRSVELAMRYKVNLSVLSSFEEYDEKAGTLICAEEDIVESKVVSGVAYSRDEAKMTLVSVADRSGIAAAGRAGGVMEPTLRTGSGVAAGSGAGALAKVGWKPHSTSRLRFTRGTQVTASPTPARM